MSFNLFKSEEDPALIEIHISVGKTLTKLSDFKHAQTTLERGLKIALTMFISRPDHPLIAQCKMYLGLFHLEKAHNLIYEEEKPTLLKIAEKYLNEALEMQKKVYTEQGKKHMTMVNTYGGLARLARMKDSYEDASEKIKLGLNMLEEILRSSELLSKSLTNVKLIMIKGDIEANQGDNDNARKTFESALDMLKNIFKGNFHLTQKTK